MQNKLHSCGDWAKQKQNGHSGSADPFSQVDNASTGWLDENGAAERSALETEVSKWHVKLHFLFCYLLHLLAETFERRLQFVPQLTFRL